MSPLARMKAFPGGIDGRTYRGIGGSRITVEPTNRGDRSVEVWTGADGSAVAMLGREARALSQDLARRAEVLDPYTPVLGPVPGPPSPPTAAAIVLDDMQDAAATLTAQRLGDETAARIRGWAEVLTHDARWTQALVAGVRRVIDAGRYVTAGDDAPRADELLAVLRGLEAVLATPPAPAPAGIPEPRSADPCCVTTERSTQR